MATYAAELCRLAARFSLCCCLTRSSCNTDPVGEHWFTKDFSSVIECICSVLNTPFLAWNNYNFFPSGKGIPSHLAQDGCKKKIAEGLLPEATDAAELYRQEMGHRLTNVSVVGTDPFQSDEDKNRAETEIHHLCSDLSALFNYTLHEHYGPFQNCVMDVINITRRCA